MTRQPQNAQKGFLAQNEAAFSLFLQYLNKAEFEYIQLEGNRLEDFTIFLKDGSKILCENKVIESDKYFSYSSLKDVLHSIRKKGLFDYNQDRILIVCNKFSPALVEEIDFLKYLVGSENWEKHNKVIKLKNKGYEEEDFKIFKNLDFWKVDHNKHEVMSLYMLDNIMSFWIPSLDLQKLRDHILVKKILKGSSEGKKYKRSDFINDLEDYRQYIQQKNEYTEWHQEMEDKVEEVVKKVEKEINLSPNDIEKISTNISIFNFLMSRIENKKVQLNKYESLWNAAKRYPYSVSMIRVFKNNMDNNENLHFILHYINKNIPYALSNLSDRFFYSEIIDVLNKILDSEECKDENLQYIFQILLKLFNACEDEYFYVTDNSSLEYEKEQVCSILKILFSKGNKKMKENIYTFIRNYFNLIRDDGDYTHYTPSSIYEIVREYLLCNIQNFPDALNIFINDLAIQYDRAFNFKRKDKQFDGWDYIGGMSHSVNSRWRIPDLHLIRNILKPVIKKYYETNKKEAWNYITCSSLAPVSRNNPNFLKRSFIKILLETYFSKTKESKTSFEVIKTFLGDEDGIPLKSSLIFQSVNSNEYKGDIEKKLLIETYLKDKTFPLNPFVDEIMANLCMSDKKEVRDWARELFLQWFSQEEYFDEHNRFRAKATNTLQDLIKNNIDLEYFILLLEKFVTSEFFAKYDTFYVHPIAEIINDILAIDTDYGLSLLKKLHNTKELSENVQILITESLFRNKDNSLPSKAVVNEVHLKFVKPIFEELNNDIVSICKRFPNHHVRQNFVEFACTLAKHGEVKKALDIIRIFINDPDPYLPEDEPNEENLQYNEHARIQRGEGSPVITSVRGYCAWGLMNCAVDSGRDYIDEILNLTEYLLSRSEKNYYVKHMVSSPLSQLAAIKFSTTKDRKRLFLDDDLETALQKAKRIEEMVFDYLDQILEYPEQVQVQFSRDIVSIVGRTRSLNQQNAEKLVEKLLRFPKSMTADFIFLIIYFAYYRKDDYKDWKWKTQTLYNDLSKPVFNPNYFVNILEKKIQEKDIEFCERMAWKLASMAKPEKDAVVDKQKDWKFIMSYLTKLSNIQSSRLWDGIFSFIKDHISEYFEDCYSLWEKTLNAITKSKSSIRSYYRHIDTLLEIYEQKGIDHLIQSLETLLKKAKALHIGELKPIIDILIENEDEKHYPQIKDIFTQLMRHNPVRYYDVMQEWLKKVKLPN